MLNPGGSIHLAFADWFVPPTDSIVYEMCVYTDLDGDMVHSNDTLCKMILATDPSSHDVGTDSIVGLPDTVWADSTYSFGAWVHNYGDYWEQFDVECIISPGGYVDTFEAAFAAPGRDFLCSFGPWTVPSGAVSYDVCVQTLLAGDADPSNDTLCIQTFSIGPGAHDVGVESTPSPPDTILPASTQSPAAWIHNFGAYSETFDVECIITPSGYVDTLSVANLSSGSSVQCTFGDWLVPPDDSTGYAMRVTCLLPTDVNPSNDTMYKQMFAYFANTYDVGVCGIDIPSDTVEVGIMYDPTVCVENLGASNQTFWTFCKIEDSGVPVYLDSTRVNNLQPGKQRNAGLGGWTVPSSPGVVYDVCAWVEAPLDQNPLNDSLCKTTYSIVGLEEAGTRSERVYSRLYQNTPNPFQSTTLITYELNTPGMVSLSIYDATGSLVTVLVNRRMNGGSHHVSWDGRNNLGLPVPEGIYFYKLALSDLVTTKKLVLLR
jgi:hypothetical protein